MKCELRTANGHSSASEPVLFTSVDQLRERAAEWDDLWQRSDVMTPGLRAEMVALWVEKFGTGCALHALAVQREGRLVAALPLLFQRRRGTPTVGSLPNGDWSSCGELLWDPQVEATTALVPLVRALRELPWTLLWLNSVSLESNRWQLFCELLATAGLLADVDPRFEIGTIDIDHNWEKYRASWTRMHRRNMKRYVRRLEKEAPLRLRVFSQPTADEIEPLLHRGFTVEDRSWKARTGSSVLRSDGMFDYYVRQARQLASWDQLELVFLELGDRPIAFELGWTAKGVYHAAKVGYDEEYAASSPGQLLRYLLFEEFFADPQRRAVDFMGVLTDATGKWSNRTYPVGRIVVARHGLVGRGVLSGYRQIWSRMRRLCRRK